MHLKTKTVGPIETLKRNSNSTITSRMRFILQVTPITMSVLLDGTKETWVLLERSPNKHAQLHRHFYFVLTLDTSAHSPKCVHKPCTFIRGHP